MKITHFLRLIKKSNPYVGFTLTELLVGSLLSSFVITIAGWGLVHFLSVDQKASAKGDIQYNSNRTLAFIADEVKLATTIESDAVAALAKARDFTLPDGAKPILVLKIQDIPEPVIYYTKQAEGVWDGPYMMERWGPDFNADGEYDSTEINNPEKWKADVVIDSIDDTPETPNCPRDWQASNTNSTRGFNACVNTDEKLVKLNLATTTDNTTWNENVNYQVETMAFARTSTIPAFDLQDNVVLATVDPSNSHFEE